MYTDSNLKNLHNSYKNCINDEITKHLNNKTVPTEELCLGAKKEFYDYLHQAKKIEHDNIMRYITKFSEAINKQD
jgi:hypothetical protein